MDILQELFAQGFLSEDSLEKIRKEFEKTGKTAEELVLEKRIISEEELFKIKSKIFGIPLQKVYADQIPVEVLEIVPQEASMNYKIAAIDKTKDFVKIGMVYPENIAAQNALRFLANQENFSYHVYLITPGELADILKQRTSIASETKKALKEIDVEQETRNIVNDNIQEKNYTTIVSEEAPVTKMVMVILRHAVDGGASDIHIEPGKDKSFNVRFRLNGILHTTLRLPMEIHPAIVARIKILSNLKIDETRVPQDGRFSARINGKDIDFRVSTFPTLYGEKVELRVLDSSVGMKSFEDLGITGRNLEIIKEAIKKPYGMILTTGPTGSGKTTTQYAILHELNQDAINIVTLEDPVEYSITGINQSQIKPEIGYTFAKGLRQILRQDPNVIMVGEIRDQETADLAVNAALTGHIVLSTLHTNSSVGVVPRLIDMGVMPFLIPSALKVVIAQRLIRVLCSNCKIKIKPEEKTKNYLIEKIKGLPAHAKSQIKINLSDNIEIYAAKGCDKCGHSGYKGRMGLYEVMSMSDELAELIQKNPLESLILKVAQKQGMLTMEQEGVVKVLTGQTTIEEVFRVAEEN
jgi:type IV pilus assembly protein PilB